MNYTVIMKRTYETAIVIEAQTEAEAIAIAESSPNRYAEELEQCNVIEESYCIEGPVEAPKAGVWDFVEKYYPRYSSSDEIATANDIDQILTESDQEWSEGATRIWEGYESDLAAIAILQDEVMVSIYRKAIEGYLESLKA